MYKPRIVVPAAWPQLAVVAVLEAVALAHWGMVWIESWCVNSPLERVRLEGEHARLEAENARLKEELRIKDARMAQLPARNRPHYPPAERLAILALKAAWGWSAARTARRFLLTPPTVSDWLRRVERDGEQSLVRVPEPVNRFPDLVRLLVKQLRALVPAMGYNRIANLLAAAGLHLSATSVKRFVEERPSLPEPPVRPEPEPEPEESEDQAGAAANKVAAAPQRTVTARYPGHVWNCDLTVVTLFDGFWAPWWPGTLPQVWPFCWWVGAVVDHYSRRVIAWRLFWQDPTATQVVGLLDTARLLAGGAPKYMVTDQGSQFRNEYREWCGRHGVKPRFGAVGRHGSIALIERFWATLKGECMRRIVVPMGYAAMCRELELFVSWYNTSRPHESLGGATPHEAYFQVARARDGPRYEPRRRWPVGEQVPLRAEPGAVVELAVTYLEGRRHLPVVELKPAA